MPFLAEIVIADIFRDAVEWGSELMNYHPGWLGSLSLLPSLEYSSVDASVIFSYSFLVLLVSFYC